MNCNEKPFEDMKIDVFMRSAPPHIQRLVHDMVAYAASSISPTAAGTILEALMVVCIARDGSRTDQEMLAERAREEIAKDKQHDCKTCDSKPCPIRREPSQAKSQAKSHQTEAEEEKTTPLPTWLQDLDLPNN